MICGTDIDILKREYSAARGRKTGHELADTIAMFGSGVWGVEESQRILRARDHVMYGPQR